MHHNHNHHHHPVQISLDRFFSLFFIYNDRPEASDTLYFGRLVICFSDMYIILHLYLETILRVEVHGPFKADSEFYLPPSRRLYGYRFPGRYTLKIKKILQKHHVLNG